MGGVNGLMGVGWVWLKGLLGLVLVENFSPFGNFMWFGCSLLAKNIRV